MICMIDWASSSSANEFETSLFAKKLFEIERKNGVKGSTHFMNTILALIVFEGLIKKFHPKLDFQKEARKLLINRIFIKARNKTLSKRLRYNSRPLVY